MGTLAATDADAATVSEYPLRQIPERPSRISWSVFFSPSRSIKRTDDHPTGSPARPGTTVGRAERVRHRGTPVARHLSTCGPQRSRELNAGYMTEMPKGWFGAAGRAFHGFWPIPGHLLLAPAEMGAGGFIDGTGRR
jgi:hypothetical protein